MPSRSLGTLTLDLIAKIGGFTAGMDQAARVAESRSKQISGSISKLTGVFGGLSGLLGGISAGLLFREIIKNTSEAEDVARQLEARLKSTGGVAGVTKDQILDLATGLQKITTYSDEAIASSSTLLLTFSRIRGDVFIKAQKAVLDLAASMGDEGLGAATEKVGKALNNPIRGLKLLEKAGIAFTDAEKEKIKVLTESGKIQEAQNALLEKFAEISGGAAAAKANTFAGSITQLKNSFGDLLETKGGLPEATASIKELTKILQSPEIQKGFSQLTSGIFKLIGLLAEGTAKFTAFGTAVGEFFARAGGAQASDVGELNKELAKLQKNIDYAAEHSILGGPRVVADLTKQKVALLERKRLLEKAYSGFTPGSGAGTGPDPLNPIVGGNGPQEGIGGAESADKKAREALAALKATLEGQLSLFKDFNNNLLEQLDRSLELNKVSFKDYAAEKIRLQQEVIDKELEEKKTILGATKDLSERAKLVQEITSLEQQRGEIAVKAAQAQEDAQRKLTDQLTDFKAQLLEAQGDSVGAAGIRLQKEFRDVLERLKVEGDTAGTELVNSIINTELARANVDKILENQSRFADEAKTIEERIHRSRESGAIGQLQELYQLDEARKKYLETLKEQERQLKIVIAGEGGNTEANIEALRRLQVQEEELASQTDLLAQKFDTLFSDSFADAVVSVVDGTKSIGDAFKDMVTSILSELTRIAAQDVAGQIFGSSGATGGGIGSFLASLFGSGAGGTGSAAGDALFAGIGFAKGGRYPAGRLRLVGEDGPELDIPDTAGRVIPNNLLGGGQQIHQTFVLPSGVQSSRQTQAQVAAAAARGLALANQRNN